VVTAVHPSVTRLDERRYEMVIERPDGVRFHVTGGARHRRRRLVRQQR
jgi:hypothetical protein